MIIFGLRYFLQVFVRGQSASDALVMGRIDTLQFGAALGSLDDVVNKRDDSFLQRFPRLFGKFSRQISRLTPFFAQY